VRILAIMAAQWVNQEVARWIALVTIDFLEICRR
jgi:hypothetical protein